MGKTNSVSTNAMAGKTLQQKIVIEAQSWLGTPWHLNQESKGLGVDCVRFITSVYRNCGVPIREIEAYYAKPKGNEILEAIESFGFTDTSALPIKTGDILVFKVGRFPWHCAIATSDVYMIHCDRYRGVIHTNIGFWLDRLVAKYSLLGS